MDENDYYGYSENDDFCPWCNQEWDYCGCDYDYQDDDEEEE